MHSFFHSFLPFFRFLSFFPFILFLFLTYATSINTKTKLYLATSANSSIMIIICFVLFCFVGNIRMMMMILPVSLLAISKKNILCLCTWCCRLLPCCCLDNKRRSFFYRVYFDVATVASTCLSGLQLNNIYIRYLLVLFS